MKHTDNEATIRMVQTSPNRWQIETRRGYVLVGDILLGNVLEAEDYVKRYLSSYRCWNYEMVPIKKDEV